MSEVGSRPGGLYVAPDVNTVECELREIDDDFASGRMSAFGAPATHESIVKELRKLSELEQQVFIRTNSIIKATVGQDHALQKVIFSPTGLSGSAGVSIDQASTSLAVTGSSGGDALMGFTDKAFDEFSRHFRHMESAFSAVGDNLRHMSKHMATLNETVGRVNSGGGAAAMK
jgi:hypothetical protein